MPNADLRRRLRRVGITRPTAPATRKPLEAGAVPLETAVPGQVVDTDAGPCYLVESRYPLAHRHGPFPLGELLRCSPKTAAQLAQLEPPTPIELSRLAFLDTETTGLAGGTGSLAFLVGVGVVAGTEFHLRQYLLRDPAEEPAMLASVAEVLADCDGVVTFNGRTFDLPLLHTRFILSRQAVDLARLAHLDLLHPARRLWRGRVTNCSLGTLEQEVLELRRTADDVPGWLIPEIYARYLRTADARELGRVIYHNTTDILSMVSLATHLLQLFAEPLASARSGPDCLRLARWLEDQGQADRAEQAYRAALDRELPAAQRVQALQRYAALLKRADRRVEAVPLWQQLAERVPANPDPCVEIAMYYEWHARELQPAIRWTERALQGVETWSPTWRRDEMVAALRHRLNRLYRKQAADA